MKEKNDIEKIKDKVFSGRSESLNIYRVPTKCLKIFKEFSNQNFAGDYGAALAFLVYNYLDLPATYRETYDLLIELEKKVDSLENSVYNVENKLNEENNEPIRKNLLGKEIK